MRARTSLTALLALSLGTIGGIGMAGAARAAAPQAALGDSGDVYFVQAGVYGDLFPGGTDTDPGNAVLAMDIVRQNQTTQRVLVPGTEGPDVESNPYELYETTSGSLFLVWQTQVGTIHPVLNLSSFKAGAWSDPIQITGNPFAQKSSPQFAITRDTYEVQDPNDGTYSTVHRTILHLIWWEEAAKGGGNVLYAPILLLDGTYVGSYQVFNLNGFLANQTLSGATGAAAELFRAARIQAGSSSRSVVVGLADTASQRLVTMEISMLPGGLVSISDDVRAHIIETGSKFLPKNLNGLANDAHDALLNTSVRLHPGVLSYLADQVRAHIIETGVNSPSQLTSLGADVRAHIIETGATMVGSRIDDFGAKADSNTFASIIQQINVPGNTGPEHMFQVNIDSSRPVPRTGSAPNSIFVSMDGSDAIVSWDLATEVRYRESTAQGWGAIQSLTLDSTMDLDRAHAILDQHVRDR